MVLKTMELINLFLKTSMETINFVIPILAIIFMGLWGVELLFGIGVMKKLELIGKPLTKVANLPPESGIAFVTAFGSHSAANAMLQELWDNKKITEMEVLLSSVLNGTTAPLKETFQYHLPVILPALGLYVGSIYIASMWLGTIMVLMFVILAGRLFLPERNLNDIVRMSDRDRSLPKRKILSITIKKSAKNFKRIAKIFVVASFIMFLLINMGFFDAIQGFILPLAEFINLPPSVIPALTTYIASPTMGFPMIGALISNNKISGNMAIIALLSGSMLMLPVLYIKLYFPQWISIFRFRLGVIRGLITMSLLMITRGAILLIFVSLI